MVAARPMVTQRLVGLAGEQQRAGPDGRVVPRVGGDLLGEGERVGGATDLQQRPGVHHPVGRRDGAAGELGGPLGVLDGQRRLAVRDRAAGGPAERGDAERHHGPGQRVRA